LVVHQAATAARAPHAIADHAADGLSPEHRKPRKIAVTTVVDAKASAEERHFMAFLEREVARP
jgi:hypothetical protein